MPVILKHAIAHAHRRLASERGAALMIALGVLSVTSMLVVGTYAAVQADTVGTQRDLESKRAYYAARAGVQKFLRDLNNDPNLWSTCPRNLTKTEISPGAAQSYTYTYILQNGNTACHAFNNLDAMVDEETGTFQMQFTGYAGNPEVKRGLIVSFRKDTPIDYLWFTRFETLDPQAWDPSKYSTCAKPARAPWNRDTSICREIVWVSGDDVNGPAYTKDQYRINGSAAPIFGRTKADKIESTVESANPNDICMNGACHNADFKGEMVPSAEVITPPQDNSQLEQDAVDHGNAVYEGLTKVVLNGGTATITRCPSTGCQTPFNINLGRYSQNPSTNKPIIYVKNGSGCTPSYTPFGTTYPSSMVSGGTAPATSNCGDVYVSGLYNHSLTIAAENDIILTGNVRRNFWLPAPVLGLIANQFVRVMHGVSPRAPGASCGSADNVAALTQSNPIFDAAILALTHSFIVDNYDCGDEDDMGELRVNGAIAQEFRGTVGTTNDTGYLKDYNYDDRLAVAQPPYLFDIATSTWRIFRETLCVPGGGAPSTQC